MAVASGLRVEKPLQAFGKAVKALIRFFRMLSHLVHPDRQLIHPDPKLIYLPAQIIDHLHPCASQGADHSRQGIHSLFRALLRFHERTQISLDRGDHLFVNFEPLFDRHIQFLMTV